VRKVEGARGLVGVACGGMPITRGGPLRTRYQLEAALAAADLGMWEWEVPSGVITWTPTLEWI
jgi:hypothetical protein